MNTPTHSVDLTPPSGSAGEADVRSPAPAACRCQLRLFSVIVDPSDNPRQVERDVREYLEQVQTLHWIVLALFSAIVALSMLLAAR